MSVRSIDTFCRGEQVIAAHVQARCASQHAAVEASKNKIRGHLASNDVRNVHVRPPRQYNVLETSLPRQLSTRATPHATDCRDPVVHVIDRVARVTSAISPLRYPWINHALPNHFPTPHCPDCAIPTITFKRSITIACGFRPKCRALLLA